MPIAGKMILLIDTGRYLRTSREGNSDMFRRNISTFRTLNFLLDLVATLASLFVSAEIYRLLKSEPLSPSDWILAQYQQAILAVLIWSVLLQLRSERYTYRIRTVLSFVTEIGLLVGYGSAGLLIASYLMHIPFLPRIQFVAFACIDAAALIILRVTLLKALHHYRSLGRNCRRALVVGTRERAKQFIDTMCEQRHWGYRVVGMILLDPQQTHYRYRDIPLIGLIGDFADIVRTQPIDEVIFAVPGKHLEVIRDAVSVCDQTGITACLQLDLPEANSSRQKIGDFAGRPVVVYSREPDAELTLAFKAVFDRALGLIGLVAALPLLLAIAIGIKASSRGPVLFSQTRCGLRGKPFRLLKFRTMVMEAESLKEDLVSANEMDGPAFKIKNDPRVTPVGRILRRLSLDELPQLINIVMGDMSLVGPRPSLPKEVEQYDLWQRRRLSMKPGLTCLWQVGRRNDATFDEWMKQDLEYIDHWSLWLDAKVIARTIPAVIRATGR
jgi:exopolysaccharide biosynthesis polyprenyl glycosylphosphotransferase